MIADGGNDVKVTSGNSSLPAITDVTYSIGDPALVEYFHLGVPNYSGVEINETTAMSLSAVYRAVSLIAGTIAGLPLPTLRETADGMRQRVASFLDDPGAVVGMVPFTWKQTVVAHVLLHGDAFLRHIYGGAGQIIGLQPIHPLCVLVEPPRPDDDLFPFGGKWFALSLPDGTRLRLDAKDITHVMGLSLDGWRGMSVISAARNGFGTAVAGDRAAARLFSNGGLISGMVTPDDDLEETDAQKIRSTIDRYATGWENNAAIPVINRRLKFTPWTMPAKDAQFLESRQFSVIEVARWFGVPPHLLMETSAQSNWGTGIEQQNVGLSRFVLNGWACLLEQTLSRLLPKPRFVEFDFARLERGSPAEELALLIQKVQAGLMTIDEARAVLNLPPIDPGPTPAQQAQPSQPAPEGAPA